MNTTQRHLLSLVFHTHRRRPSTPHWTRYLLISDLLARLPACLSIQCMSASSGGGERRCLAILHWHKAIRVDVPPNPFGFTRSKRVTPCLPASRGLCLTSFSFLMEQQQKWAFCKVGGGVWVAVLSGNIQRPTRLKRVRWGESWRIWTPNIFHLICTHTSTCWLLLVLYWSI